jgi:beta-galactosidase
MADFRIGEHDFLLDGEPFRVLSGALHYFRVHPDHWADRIHKARLMGLNTIETYVAWNEHSPRRGEFRTTGGLDLARFLRLVADEGMYAIVRPGPFICAEWDNGGLPGWLFGDPEVGVRRSEPKYLAAVEEYFDQLLPIVQPLQIQHGGPVILVQIENEYGAYGDDKDYLRELTRMTRAHGIDVPLTTIDQPTHRMLEDGGLPELHKTGSFGSRATERLATLREHQPTGPLMCAEFWCGWFDHWGAHHHTTSVEDSARELDELLAAGASVNVYMFHGGTNFGLTNGANDKGVYQPTVTSYDYDAPLSESGEPTAKYHAFRSVIAKYAPVPDESPAIATAAPAIRTAFEATMPLWRALPALTRAELSSETAPTVEDLEQYRGFTLYECRAPRGGVLEFAEVRDRAQVFLDGASVGVLDRDHHDRSIVLPHGGRLRVLVEDQGRVNYGPRIGERKGLIGPVTLGGVPLREWSTIALDLEGADAATLVLSRGADAVTRPSAPLAGPVLARAEFDLDQPADLFLSTDGWSKGTAGVNGFPLGRYWSKGPQRTLYVPAPATRAGRNELVVFEQQATVDAHVRFVSHAELGHTEW